MPGAPRSNPETLRYRLLHAGGRLARSAASADSISVAWPWPAAIVTAWDCISAPAVHPDQHQTIPAIRDVPLLIEDRDAAALELRAARINVFFVYAPPLDEYSEPEFCEPTPLPRAARWWATHILPIDPHDAERALDLVRKNQIRLMPAAPLPV